MLKSNILSNYLFYDKSKDIIHFNREMDDMYLIRHIHAIGVMFVLTHKTIVSKGKFEVSNLHGKTPIATRPFNKKENSMAKIYFI